MKKVLLTLLFVLCASVIHAQTIAVNPTLVEFVVSADDTAVNALTGIPVVTRYELRVYIPTILTTIVATQDLGKPTPVAGKDTVNLGSGLITTLLKNTVYIAEVAAIGPAGEGVSAASNPFGFAQPKIPVAPNAAVIK
jgi:hypothetical protein